MSTVAEHAARPAPLADSAHTQPSDGLRHCQARWGFVTCGARLAHDHDEDFCALCLAMVQPLATAAVHRERVREYTAHHAPRVFPIGHLVPSRGRLSPTNRTAGQTLEREAEVARLILRGEYE